MKLKHFFSIFMAIALIFSFSVSELQVEADSNESNSEDSEIIVKFKEKTTKEDKQKIHKEENAEVLRANEEIGFEVIKVKGKSVEKALEKYNKRSDVEFAEAIVEYYALFDPNDPLYSSDQYGPQIIEADSAWDITTGSSNVLVAVIDTGVDEDHEDLAGKVVRGYDFIDDDRDPSDLNGHGTHVAGTVGALTDNRTGVAGVAPDVQIMSVRVLDRSGYGTNEGVANGITYAADNGADVINLSLGSSSPSGVVEDAVNYAWNRGVVVVAAAGNDGNRRAHYPAYYTNSLAVAATDDRDRKASFSTYGTWVDVAAPGVDIVSTQLGGGYVSYSGTSMAAPHTAGLAALLASQGLSNTEIRDQIESTADPIRGTGRYWEHGRINAFEAVR
ncbi:S8 family peptidase [Chengkuizengella axinellae]|uniref:S8 family peptidase n=1 Tax=Chengkuizengella axinellae TaxID=3064388 RepID=A0ABT9J4Q3_9BACL|nr:S8 family peptidase [Chengkuizengella sp. 2205SS18-9]MDP5276575.1 S8 family peptidase [Chengkuizengella sp. 2205SS18-9]